MRSPRALGLWENGVKNGIIFMVSIIIWTIIKLVFKLLAVIVKVLASLIIFFGLYIPLFYGVFGIILLATTEFTFGGAGTDQVLYYIGFGLCCVASVIISIRNLIVRPLSTVFAPFVEYRDEVRKARDGMRKRDGEEGSDGPRDPRAYDPRYGQGYPPYGEYPQQYTDRQPYDASSQYRPHAPYYEDAPRGGNPYEAPRPPYDRQWAEPRAPYYGDDRAEPQTSYPDYGRDPRAYVPAPERPLIYYSKRRPGVLVKEYSDRFELFEDDNGEMRYIGTEYKDE